MAQYFGVKAVLAKGEMFLSWEQFNDGRVIHPKVPPGKRLIALKIDVDTATACDVTLPADWLEMIDAYKEVAFATCEFYVIDEAELPLCPDEGRVPYTLPI